MFFTKIFHFLKGYVILSVTGNNKEKFISEMAQKGCRIFDVKYGGDEITAKISAYDAEFFLAEESDYDITVKEKYGLIHRLTKNKGAIAVVVVFALIISVGAQFIWDIEYDADKGVIIEDVEAAASIAGLKKGAYKRRIPKPEEIKNIILNHTDGICWCWVYIKGTKATIRVRKSVMPPEIFSEETPCDIIAMRSGIIKRVISQKGRCVVEENQAVSAGETLISGTFEFDDAAGYQVHSKGIAEAYTTHTKTGVYEQMYCYKTYTGRLQRFLTLKLYKWELPLYIKSRVRFENYDSIQRDHDAKIGKDFYIGIGLRVNELKEYETKKEPISYETAVIFAQNQLERDISRELLPEAQLISKHCDAERLGDMSVKVTVTMDFIEKIGTEKRIEEVKIIEPKNSKSAGGD